MPPFAFPLALLSSPTFTSRHGTQRPALRGAAGPTPRTLFDGRSGGPRAGIAPREGAESRQFVEEVAAAARENEEAAAPATPSWGTAPLLAEPRRPACSGERQEPPVGGSRQ